MIGSIFTIFIKIFQVRRQMFYDWNFRKIFFKFWNYLVSKGVNFYFHLRSIIIIPSRPISHKVIRALLVVSLKTLESNFSHLVIGSKYYLTLIEINSYYPE